MARRSWRNRFQAGQRECGYPDILRRFQALRFRRSLASVCGGVLFLITVTGWAQTTVDDPPARLQDAPAKEERPEGINDGFLDSNLDPGEWVERFEVESREIFAQRNEILATLQLKPGEHVADVGTGTGLFLALLSNAVGDTGHVYAVDISPKLIEFVDDRIDRESLTNVSTVLSAEDSTHLKDRSVDVVFVCDTYHHFEDFESMLRSIRFALRPNGRFIVVDFERIPGQSREWVLGHVRADKKTVRKEIEQAGFVFDGEPSISELTENYVLRFRRP